MHSVLSHKPGSRSPVDVPRARAGRAERGSQRSAARAGNDSGGECGVAVAARFLMPGAAGLGSAPPAEPCGAGGTAAAVCGRRRRARALANPPFWYAFEYGSVHFSIVSSEHDLTRGSEQREARAARNWTLTVVTSSLDVHAVLGFRGCK